MATEARAISAWREHHRAAAGRHQRISGFYRRLAHVSHFTGTSFRTTLHLYASSKMHSRIARQHGSLARSKRVHINRREGVITAPVAGGGIHRDRLGRFA